MVIGIDASRANKKHKTGTEWYSYYLIRWLAKLDNKNQYILYTNKPLMDGLLDLSTKQYIGDSSANDEIKYDSDGYQIIKSPFNNFKAKVLNWPLNCFWTLGRLSLEMLINKPDTLFVPAHTLPFVYPKRSIVTIHDVAFKRNNEIYPNEKINGNNTFFYRLLNLFIRIFTLNKYGANSVDYLHWSTEFILKKAHKIITVSDFSKNDIIDCFGTNSEKIKVVHNGYNKYLYKKIGDKDKIKKVLNEYGVYGPYFLYIGRIEKKKNIPNLIEAYAIMKQNNKNIKEKLVLVGDASYGYDETNYIIREFELDDEVIMPGWIEEKDLPYIYNGASAFVFPSVYEGFGIPLLQAMASCLPIATSKSTSIPEVVGDAALFFDHDDINSMAEAMETIIIDKSLREKLIARGEKQSLKFSWEICARDTLKEIIEV